MEQNTAFEKFFPKPLAFADKAHELEMLSKWNDAKITWETSLESANAEANKRIEALESEVAAFEAISFVQMKKIDELQASNNDLREALKYTLYSLEGRGIPAGVDPANLTVQYHKCKNILQQALSATPAESLQAFENDVIEKCAELANYMPFNADEMHEYRASDDCKAMAWDIYHSIRKLKVEVK